MMRPSHRYYYDHKLTSDSDVKYAAVHHLFAFLLN